MGTTQKLDGGRDLVFEKQQGGKWENVTDKSKVKCGLFHLGNTFVLFKRLSYDNWTTGRRSLFFKGGRHGKRHDQGNNVRTCPGEDGQKARIVVVFSFSAVEILAFYKNHKRW